MDNLIIAPSILSADFSCLKEELKKLEEIGIKWVHLDVMDGHFVPNLTIGMPVIKSLRKVSKLFFDVHLMIDKPEFYVKQFIESGSDLITLHYESTSEENLIEIINKIHEYGKKAGLALKPATPLSSITSFLSNIDLLLIMTVEPGFGGQTFMRDMLPKIKELKQIKEEKNYSFLIEVDGGINANTVKDVKKAGAEVIVSGSYIFKSSDYKLAINQLLQ